MMTKKNVGVALVGAAALLAAGPRIAQAAEASLHHIHITTGPPPESVRWYAEHMGCTAMADRTDAAKCGPVELIFVEQQTMGGTQRTGVNHISFSFPDLPAKMAALEKVGVRGSGIRFQRFADNSTHRDLPGMFKHGFIFDPWGTRIELVEDPETLGFHHIHLSATDPAATLKWYQTVFGGTPATLKGRMNGLKFGQVWVLADKHEEGTPATTRARAIDHIGFVAKSMDQAMTDLRSQRAAVLEEPAVPRGGRTAAKHALVAGPDNVRVEVVEPGFAGVKTERAAAAVSTEKREPYTTPRTPWGEPDLQGIYTGNSANGIPLERPKDLADVKNLTPEEAAARRERRTLASIWGYDREWRDTTLGYVKTAPSTQVAMIIDPPDGRLPPRTPDGERRAEAARRQNASDEGATGQRAAFKKPEDLSPFVRCITRGLPGMMIPGIYNNGLQIVQSAGYVAIQKEMIHETRIVPTEPRERASARITSWLGEPQGRWEGDTLVIETENFNGRVQFQGESAKTRLIERYTRVGPNQLEYRFTIDDPTTWTKPWTGMFVFDKDDSQYELVEYACHEGNYSMTNILSGARVEDGSAPQGGVKK